MVLTGTGARSQTHRSRQPVKTFAESPGEIVLPALGTSRPPLPTCSMVMPWTRRHAPAPSRRRPARARPLFSRSTALRWPSVIGSRPCPPSTYSRVGSTAAAALGPLPVALEGTPPCTAPRRSGDASAAGRADRYGSNEGRRSSRPAPARGDYRPRRSRPRHCVTGPSPAVVRPRGIVRLLAFGFWHA